MVGVTERLRFTYRADEVLVEWDGARRAPAGRLVPADGRVRETVLPADHVREADPDLPARLARAHVIQLRKEPAERPAVLSVHLRYEACPERSREARSRGLALGAVEEEEVVRRGRADVRQSTMAGRVHERTRRADLLPGGDPEMVGEPSAAGVPRGLAEPRDLADHVAGEADISASDGQDLRRRRRVLRGDPSGADGIGIAARVARRRDDRDAAARRFREKAVPRRRQRPVPRFGHPERHRDHADVAEGERCLERVREVRGGGGVAGTRAVRSVDRVQGGARRGCSGPFDVQGQLLDGPEIREERAEVDGASAPSTGYGAIEVAGNPAPS